MNYIKLIQSYYDDMDAFADLLTRLVDSYKLLISAAEEVNRVALAKKGDVEDAMERAQEMGKIIDRLLDVLDVETCFYADYARTKSQYIANNYTFSDMVKYEVDYYLKVDDEEHHH